MRGMLAQEGSNPPNQCTSKVVQSLREQIIQCMEGRQNFIAIEKCDATHTVQLAEEEHRLCQGLEAQETSQHFRAVARLGNYDALPTATILGPPYGGVLRPAGELAMMQMIHDRLRDLKGPPRQSYAFRIENLGYIGEWEARQDKAEARCSECCWRFDAAAAVKGSTERDTGPELEEYQDCIAGEGREISWQPRSRPLTSLDEIHNYVQKTMNKLASCSTIREAEQIEREFRMNDPDIRMDSCSTIEPDSPELDAMDYRSEYSMMNDANGSASISNGNNCHSLLVIIGGLPFFFPITNRPIRNGEELLLSYGPHYWTEAQSTEALLSSTYQLMTGLLTMAFENKRNVFDRNAHLEESNCRLVQSRADERAAEDVAELLARLHVCNDQGEQRKQAAAWLEELKKTLQREGRGYAVLEALDRAATSLASGADVAVTFADLKAATDTLTREYHQRTVELQQQVEKAEEARKSAEKESARLQLHLNAVNDSSQVQASRLAKLKLELQRMHAISQRHFVERERITSSRSIHSDDCPYAKITELLGVQGLPIHATGSDVQRHEDVCKARGYLLSMGFLDIHTSKCRQCGWPFVKGPLAPHGEEQHLWHCRGENNDIAELVEEGEELAKGQGFLLQRCLNILSRDSEICWFLFELLCCLAKTFARLVPKHKARNQQWQQLCLQEAHCSSQKQHRLLHGRPGGQERQREACKPPLQQQEAHGPSQESEVEDGELEPDACHEGVHMADNQSTRMVKELATTTHCTDPHARDTTPDSACVASTKQRSCSACICAGRNNWERTTKRFRCGEGTTDSSSNTQRLPRFSQHADAFAGYGQVRSEASFDFDAMVLEAFEEDPVSRDTDWVGWLLELPVLRWTLTADTEAERRRQVHLLMCNFPLLLHAVFSVCCNNCLGFSLIPASLNRDNWLGEFLEAVHQCLEEVESECDAQRATSETTPTMWISRFFRAVEGAHVALSAIEAERKAVDVQALERHLAKRRCLLRKIEDLRDRRAAASMRAAQCGDSGIDDPMQNETAEECELWKAIYKLSEAVKTRVSVHLNAWGQQLAYFIDTRYLRLEQYERHEMWREERLRASRRKLQGFSEAERYMTSEQKALCFRNKRRETGGKYLRYFAFRTRMGEFDDCVDRVKYFAGLEGGNVSTAINKTLSLIADYAGVRPGTWDRDVKRRLQPELNSQLREISSAEEADRLLGKPLFERALEHWPQLRRLVDIGATRAVHAVQLQLSDTRKQLEQSRQQARRLQQQIKELHACMQRLQQTGPTEMTSGASQTDANAATLACVPQLVSGEEACLQHPEHAVLLQDKRLLHQEYIATSQDGEGATQRHMRVKQEAGPATAAHERIIATQNPGTNPCTLLQLYCEDRSAHTVIRRGDFPRVSKEIKDDVQDGSGDSRHAVFRYLLPPTPFVFEPPIDVNKSGCLHGYLPAGRNDHFTLDVVLRLPALTSTGSRIIALNSREGRGRRFYHPQDSNQQLTSIYDPLVCTRESPPEYAMLLSARYWIVPRGKYDRIQRVDLGMGMRIPSHAPSAATSAGTQDGRAVPSLCDCHRVTLKCTSESAGGCAEASSMPAMRVVPFVNGVLQEPLMVPRMPDFYKICSILFSCDFNPDQLPAPPGIRLLLPTQRYRAAALDDGRLEAEELSIQQTALSTATRFSTPERDANQRNAEPHETAAANRPFNGIGKAADMYGNARGGSPGTMRNSISAACDASAHDPFEESPAQQRRQQLMLERRLRTPSSPDDPVQTGEPQPHPPTADAEGAKGITNGSGWEQQDDPEQTLDPKQLTQAYHRMRHRNNPVPPFILRKKSSALSSFSVTTEQHQQNTYAQLAHSQCGYPMVPTSPNTQAEGPSGTNRNLYVAMKGEHTS
ncbi:uncharacterized protein LOC34622906 [Cyclospora cayetanensis]|uniref:Uncharacterized protein LOC34622906 n=1 Tax=Cyclospora cayetanensis TaxID=88456 RepID=A0A6P6S3L5_9EIME|nr:uncharacterized protein LOC34622906 [Cyclospora cayetanensis]